jgi:hypothetical protein
MLVSLMDLKIHLHRQTSFEPQLSNLFAEFNVHVLFSISRYSDWLLARRPRGQSSSPSMVKNFLFSMSSRPALGSTQPQIQWVLGALSPGIKRRQGCEADHSPQASAEVKNMWIYTSTP